MLRPFARLLAIAFLPTIILAQQQPGDTCEIDSDCSTYWCDYSNETPDTRRCLSRPARLGASCRKEFESNDCESGHCDESSNTCGKLSTGSACSEDRQCDGTDICDRPVGSTSTDDRVCLAVGLVDFYGCSVGRQCNSGCCPTSWIQCRPASECGGGTSITPGSLETFATCTADVECGSGICDVVFDEDVAQNLCLPKEVAENAVCVHDRQCTTGYCMPSDTPAEAPHKPGTCGKDFISTTNPGTGTGNNGGGNNNDNGGGNNNGGGNGNGGVERVTTTINGQPTTAVRTTSVGASGSRSASRVGASASATGGAMVGSSLDGVLGLTGLLAVVLGAVVF